MKITQGMQYWIELAIEEHVKNAYPKTGGKSVMDKIKTSTLESLKSQKGILYIVLFNALRMATENEAKNAEYPEVKDE